MDHRVNYTNLQASMVKQGEEEIDLMEIIRLLLHRIWLLALAFIVGAGITYACIHVFVTPEYTARSTIYVFSTEEDTTTTTLNISNQMTKDFQIIATTRNTINMVIEQLNLNMSYSELMNQCNITVSNPSGSHMLRISVEHSEPVLAANISNALANVLREQIAQVMNTEKPSFVEMASVPVSPSSPKIVRTSALVGIGVALVAAAIILVRYFMNDTITTEDDVSKYLGMTILAAVPLERNLTKQH